jgi:hypothetical protein
VGGPAAAALSARALLRHAERQPADARGAGAALSSSSEATEELPPRQGAAAEAPPTLEARPVAAPAPRRTPRSQQSARRARRRRRSVPRWRRGLRLRRLRPHGRRRRGRRRGRGPRRLLLASPRWQHRVQAGARCRSKTNTAVRQGAHHYVLWVTLCTQGHSYQARCVFRFTYDNPARSWELRLKHPSSNLTHCSPRHRGEASCIGPACVSLTKTSNQTQIDG